MVIFKSSYDKNILKNTLSNFINVVIENKIKVPIDKNFYEVTIKAGLLSEIGNKLVELGIKNTRKI